MKTSEFLEFIRAHQEKALKFEYRPNSFVGANYHITEVKNVVIDAVDCGAGVDSRKETVIQLWESPNEKDKTEFMTVYKALGILNKVSRMRAMIPESEIKFEYGNDHFHTAQLFVDDFELNQDSLVVKLAVEKTDCKAKEACGVAVESVATASSSCGPGSDCC